VIDIESESDMSASSINSEEERAGYFVVEKVLGDRKRKRDGVRELLVRWKGYDSEENSWEPEVDMKRMAEERVEEYWGGRRTPSDNEE
jgi:hypothetical protein